MSDRLTIWLNELKQELISSEIVAGLGNGDVESPGEWLSVTEHTDHVDLIDNETTESFQMGFTSVWCGNDE